MLFDHGIALIVVIALLELFLNAAQPILTATVFDVVSRDVASTGLGVITCVVYLMSAASVLATVAIYETLGFSATLYYIAVLFALAALVFANLPFVRIIAAPNV